MVMPRLGPWGLRHSLSRYTSTWIAYQPFCLARSRLRLRLLTLVMAGAFQETLVAWFGGLGHLLAVALTLAKGLIQFPALLRAIHQQVSGLNI